MLEHFQGDTLRLTIDLIQDDGTPVNLTGATVRMNVTADPTVSSYAISDDKLTKEIEPNGQNGRIVVTATAATMEITPGEYTYDIEVTYPDGTKETVLLDTIRIKQDITR